VEFDRVEKDIASKYSEDVGCPSEFTDQMNLVRRLRREVATDLNGVEGQMIKSEQIRLVYMNVLHSAQAWLSQVSHQPEPFLLEVRNELKTQKVHILHFQPEVYVYQ